MKLRVGVIGLGEKWETRHRPALRALVDRFDVRAVAAGVARRAEQAAADFQCAAIDGFRALAGREDIDALLLLGKDWYDPIPILAACEGGKAVYCTTTLHMGAQQVRRVKQQVEESGVAFMAELPRRQAPATLRLKELIATRLGEPQLVLCHQSTHQQGLEAQLSLLELCDWCRYIVGQEVTGVHSIAHQGSDLVEDYRLVSLDFRQPGTTHGALAHASYGRYLSPAWPEADSFRPPADLQVCCANGVAFVDLPATVTWFDEAGRHRESLESDRPVGEQLLNHFYRSVTSLVRRTSGLDDAYQALRILQAAEQSIAESRRISLDGDLQ